jgi:hypothetical protein
MFDDTRGFDVGAGWSTSGNDEYAVYGDYLYHINDLLMGGTGQLPLYFGGGLSYVYRDDRDDEFGVRLPIGVAYQKIVDVVQIISVYRILVVTAGRPAGPDIKAAGIVKHILEGQTGRLTGDDADAPFFSIGGLGNGGCQGERKNG